MHLIKRFFRHLFTTRAAGKRAFPGKSLKAIQAVIEQGETLHRAELKLILEPALGVLDLLAGVTPRQRACELFAEYRMWDTEENSGVLLYLNLADHQLEIVADRGVARLIASDQWQHLSHTMIRGFAAGRYEEAAVEGLQELNGLLHQVLPAGSEHNPDELPNRPIIL